MFNKVCSRKLFTILFIFVTFSFVNSAHAYVISGDKTGGDCSLIGTWDASTKTCTLTTDLYATGDNTEVPYYERFSTSRRVLLYVDSNRITLDGNGHSLIGGPYKDIVGIYLKGKRNVTIKNFTIKNFIAGIWLHIRASSNVIVNNNISDNMYGIHSFERANNNVITENILSNNSRGIAIKKNCSNNIVTENTASNNAVDIELWASGKNNTISNNSVGRIYFISFSENTILHGNTISKELRFTTSSNNIIYNNNILGFVTSLSSMNTFYLDAPTGGNYWGGNCADANLDGFCDEPHSIPSANDFDYLPWATQSGWLHAN